MDTSSSHSRHKISVNGIRNIFLDDGVQLRDGLMKNGIAVPSVCGGRGLCGRCRVKVASGGGALTPAEKSRLKEEEIRDGMRLSCQVKVGQAMEITVPGELLALNEYRCRCTRITDLARDVRELRLDLIAPGAIDFIPGQYIQLLCPSYDGHPEVYRIYSIASDVKDRSGIELVIRLVPGGICTTWCFTRLKEGDEVRINGPYGDFILRDNDSPIVMIAGGSGMSAIRSLLHQMKNKQDTRKTVLFFGVNRVDELFYLDLMKDFHTALPNFRFVPVVARPEEGAQWHGETGLVTEVVSRIISDASMYEGYLCGSPGMINAAKKVLTSLGTPAGKMYYDAFE